MKLLLLLIPCALLTGCSTTNITKLVGALAKDPAIVSVRVSSVYGTVVFNRVGTATNGVSITPDGTITVK